jgi:hypothetical protein
MVMKWPPPPYLTASQCAMMEVGTTIKKNIFKKTYLRHPTQKADKFAKPPIVLRGLFQTKIACFPDQWPIHNERS